MMYWHSLRYTDHMPQPIPECHLEVFTYTVYVHMYFRLAFANQHSILREPNVANTQRSSGTNCEERNRKGLFDLRFREPASFPQQGQGSSL